VIQNAAKDVPLVADKPTVFRAYVSLDHTMVQQVGSISGKLYYRRGSALYGPVYPMNNISTETKAVWNPDRAEYTHSLNFRLPSKAIEAGETEFYVRVNPLQSMLYFPIIPLGSDFSPYTRVLYTRLLTENDYENNRYPSSGYVSANFHARTNQFRIGYYAVNYDPPDLDPESPTDAIHGRISQPHVIPAQLKEFRILFEKLKTQVPALASV